MKKILLLIALVASMQFANAQGQNAKSSAAAKAAVEAAQKAVNDAKKNTKAATWIKYGQALLDAYNASMGNNWIGMSQQEAQLLGGKERPSSEEQVVINGQPYLKQVFSERNLYYSANGQLGIIEITKPVVEGALDKAYEAFQKAMSLDNGQKTKDISTAVESITKKIVEEAYSAYSLGDLSKSSEWFEKAVAVSSAAPVSKVDLEALYNAGFTAHQAGNMEKAKAFFEKCIENNHFQDGDVFAKLGDIAEKTGDRAASKKYLEEGFAKFPQSQGILVGLINYYLLSGDDSSRLFELLDNAKKNEPNNASLYYVEGNIRSKLGQESEAFVAWDKCAEVNPAYEYGFYGKGLYLYNKAVEIQELASKEMDDAKYNALVDDFNKALKGCIEPFEKCYEVSKDEDVKANVAEYLKNAFFRYRTESDEMMAKYNKYAGNQQ